MTRRPCDHCGGTGADATDPCYPCPFCAGLGVEPRGIVSPSALAEYCERCEQDTVPSVEGRCLWCGARTRVPA